MKRRLRPDSSTSEGGATMVEAALVMPLLIIIMLAAIDLGMWVFQTTQAASAARTGARVGILRYREADQNATADETAIMAAIIRDAGKSNVSVQIRCVEPGSTTPLPAGCQTASVVNPDRVMVKVSWSRPSLTFLTRPFGATQTVTGTSVMVINGRPTGVLG